MPSVSDDRVERGNMPQGFLLDRELAGIVKGHSEHIERKPEAIVAEGVLNLARRIEAFIRSGVDG